MVNINNNKNKANKIVKILFKCNKSKNNKFKS